MFKSTGQSDDENIFLEGQLTAPGPAATGSGNESILVSQGFFLAVFWAVLDSGVSEILSFWKNLGYFGLDFSKSP